MIKIIFGWFVVAISLLTGVYFLRTTKRVRKSHASRIAGWAGNVYHAPINAFNKARTAIKSKMTKTSKPRTHRRHKAAVASSAA